MLFVKTLLLLSVILVVSNYEIIGRRERRPFVTTCTQQIQCISCVSLGCIYYELDPIIDKTFCFPAHLNPPVQILIGKAFLDEPSCLNITTKINASGTKTTEMTTAIPTTISPPLTTSNSNTTLYTIIGVLAALIIVGIGIVFYKNCKKNNIPDVTYNPGIMLDTII